jgi:hypothetical protein
LTSLWTDACCSLLLTALVGGVPGASDVAAPVAPPVILCTPGTVLLDGVQKQEPNPIAAALRSAKPGSRIELEPGDYPGFGIGFKKQAPWNAQISGGTKAAPIVVHGKGLVRIVGKGDTISVSQDVKNGFITFENLVIVPGYRAGVIFAQGRGDWVHEGYRFYDCDILGEWNHLTDSGNSSKWGLWGQSLKDFEFKGVTRPARVRDIRREHGFYILNPRGDVTIENVEAARLGRTFCQFTARARNGAPGVGTLTVRNCRVEDCCLAAGDNFKGGSAFTVAGRLTGTIVFERNTYRAGFVPELARLTKPGAPYGTGAFVAWDGGEAEPNGTLILADNRFEFAPGCGDRALVALGGCRVVELRGANRFVAGAAPALEVEPVTPLRPEPSPVDALQIDAATQIQGAIRLRGEGISREDLVSEFKRRAGG